MAPGGQIVQDAFVAGSVDLYAPRGAIFVKGKSAIIVVVLRSFCWQKVGSKFSNKNIGGMMLKHNTNFKNRIGHSSHNFANRLWCASAHCESAVPRKMSACAKSLRWSSLRTSVQKNSSELGFSLASYAVRTRRSLDKSLYSKITGWSLAVLVVCGAFSYLTFIPEQVFAAYDWEQRTLSDIDTMQEMNAKICENTTEIETQYQLEDTRDGKKYYVAKLQDGNCWMTQNLAYSGTNKDGTKREDIGAPCTLSGLTTNSTCSGWSNSYTEKYFAIGEHRESHDSRGNFYNWPAAVAGDTSTTEQKQGICPNNWQLPISNNTNSKSFGGLTNAYSIGNNEAGSTKLRGEPLYFQYGGSVGSAILSAVGSYGTYWSSTPDTSATSYAYNLFFTSSTVRPSSNDGRSSGYSVRCVAADIYPEKPPITDNDTANVAITVSPVISIDVTKHANDMTVDFTKVAISTIIARVGSNQPYQVLLSTDKSDLTNPSTDKTIPMIPSDQTIVKGTSSWGIKKLSSPTDTAVDESTKYSPVGINGEKVLFYTSTSAASENLTFPVAIAVDSSLPSGQYSTQVTLTAVAM